MCLMVVTQDYPYSWLQLWLRQEDGEFAVSVRCTVILPQKLSPLPTAPTKTTGKPLLPGVSFVTRLLSIKPVAAYTAVPSKPRQARTTQEGQV